MSAAPVWLITGSSAGLGLALTRYATIQGHKVIGTSRNPSKTPELVKEIESRGGKWLRLDLASPESQVLEIVKEAEALFGRIDILANVAGYAVMGAFEDTPMTEIVAQMETNFYGPLKMMQGVLPGMRQRGSGMIINVSSAQGMCPSPANGIYAASKAALEAATESLSQEVAGFGIRALLIEAGAYRTDFAISGPIVGPSQGYASEDHPVGMRLGWVKKLADTAMGDPEKAAKVMFEAASGQGDAGYLAQEEKFLRIIIGPDCWKRVDEKVTELRRTADRQKELAASTNL